MTEGILRNSITKQPISVGDVVPIGNGKYRVTVQGWTQKGVFVRYEDGTGQQIDCGQIGAEVSPPE